MRNSGPICLKVGGILNAKSAVSFESTASDFVTRNSEQIRSGSAALLILRQIEYLDSSCIVAVRKLHKLVAELAGEDRLYIVAEGHVAKVLQVLGQGLVFHIFGDTRTALRAIKDNSFDCDWDKNPAAPWI